MLSLASLRFPARVFFVHNSLAPRAAGSETVAGLSVAPKLSQAIWAPWERPEGFGAWGKVRCLLGELAPRKRMGKAVFLMGWGANRKPSVCISTIGCSVSTTHGFHSGLKWITSVFVASVCNVWREMRFRGCQLESGIWEELLMRRCLIWSTMILMPVLFLGVLLRERGPNS